MGNRIFVAAVVSLWTCTMSWLVVARILPPFFQGDPPQHGVAVQEAPHCWQIAFRERTVGFAASQGVPGAFGTTEVHSRVQIEGIELRKLWPFQIGSLIHGLNTIQLDTRTRMTLDSLGALSTFDTRVQLVDVPLTLQIRGRVEGAELQVHMQSGEIEHKASFPAPREALIASDLLPESKLLDLQVGRRWQQEVFSPFKSSMEIVQAEVVAEGLIDHRGEQVNAKRIEYRSLSNAGVAADKSLRSMLWVDDDGTVLRQDLYFMSAKLRFERCHEPHMIARAKRMLDLQTHATISPTQTPQ
jgi:hypothetical protein